MDNDGHNFGWSSPTKKRTWLGTLRCCKTSSILIDSMVVAVTMSAARFQLQFEPPEVIPGQSLGYLRESYVNLRASLGWVIGWVAPGIRLVSFSGIHFLLPRGMGGFE